jgi:phycobilisome core-membrane linker protein
MTVHTNSGSPVVYPQRYHTLPTAILTQVEQQDRWLNTSELKTFSDFFRSSSKRLQIAEKLGQQSQSIIAAAANRIFYNGSAMAYLEPPPNRENLPGYTLPPRRMTTRSKEPLKLQLPSYGNPFRGLSEFLQTQLSQDRDPLPGGFRPINIKRYGPARMKRSMRDLDWFLRYAVYAIAAGDCSIITVNTRGLRGVIPEDVTEATVVAIQEMRWRSLQYFKQDPEAVALIREPFDAMIAAYRVEKPPLHLREGVSAAQQGLQLPGSYITAARPRFVMKPTSAETEKQAVIRAAYRQVFERDVTHEYGIALTDLESRLRSGEFSVKEFIRHLGRSQLYRDLFYAPYSISRVIELAVRHFLGRGLYSLDEFQTYFEVISTNGLAALVNALVHSQEYTDYFGEETVPYLRGLGQEAQECRNWGAQINLFKPSAAVHKAPQFVTQFAAAQKPLPNQHVYGTGNDCLEIQFGAIFPDYARNVDEHPAHFNSEHRRILIRCEPQQQISSPVLGVSNSLEHRIMRFHQNGSTQNGKRQGSSVDLQHHSAEAVIRAAYRQVLGREPFAGQHLTSAELKLKSGEITVREFVRRIAKSTSFRSLCWDSLYITKAIEYIHRRLLGRPTNGRAEMERYYDICARQGFYALIDALIDSREYIEIFNENTVPYERYVTPRGYELRSRHRPSGSGSPMDGTRVADGTWMQEAMQRNQGNGHSNGQVHLTGGNMANLNQRPTESTESVEATESTEFMSNQLNQKREPAHPIP